MMLRLGHSHLRTFACRAKMRGCEVAKAKVQSCESEGAILLSLLPLCNFALSPSPSHVYRHLRYLNTQVGALLDSGEGHLPALLSVNLINN